MRRVQLFEFEDFDWFPAIFRSTMTKIIVVLHKLLGTKEVVGNLLVEIHKKRNFEQIVDLGSGSGGAMPLVQDFLQTEKKLEVKMLLTDLHPNKELVREFNSNQSTIKYHPKSINAQDLKNTPEGIKTMMNSFHHMPPSVARQILKTAQKNQQTILIYEMGENMIPLVVWWLLLPISLPLVALMAILLVPFVKPLKFTDLLFTWFIPVIPLFYAWDGQASGPRTYTFNDIQELLPEKDEHYSWKVKHALKPNGKKVGYYIIGVPI